MKKACIFDLDGTLANTLPTIAYYANKALAEFGLQEIEEQQYRWLVGNGAEELVRRMLEHAGDPQMRLQEVLRNYKQLYDQDVLYLTKPYPGIPEVLKKLKEQGIILGVISNKPHSTSIMVVEELFGSQLIDRCFGQREDYPLKPDPASLKAMLKDFSVTPENCFFFGDTGVDMLTGQNAGVKTIGVLWGFRDRQELLSSGADQVIESPEEILKCIHTK